MTSQHLAHILIEQEGKAKLPRKIAVFFNRLLLRIFSVPALMNQLADADAVVSPESPNTFKIQLDFQKLPREIVPQISNLLAAPRPPKYYRYIKNGAARTGIELTVKEDDFPGSDYDYAG